MKSLIDLLIESGPLLAQGAAMTVKLWLCTAIISLSVGTLLGIVQSKKAWIKVLSPCVATITFVFRAIPFYVTLLLAYFVLPAAFGISLSAVGAGILALGFCSSSYVSQIVMAGINSIPDGQWEACHVLGFSRVNTLRYVILPQMVRNVLPALVNEMESVLKSTSIISSIGVLELTRMGMNIVSREMNPIAIYCAVAFIYFAFSCVLLVAVRMLEKKLKMS